MTWYCIANFLYPANATATDGSSSPYWMTIRTQYNFLSGISVWSRRPQGMLTRDQTCLQAAMLPSLPSHASSSFTPSRPLIVPFPYLSSCAQHTWFAVEHASDPHFVFLLMIDYLPSVCNQGQDEVVSKVFSKN